MAEAIVNPATQRYAVVTGASKGIGFEICRQLASKGIMVILTARDEKRGIEAQERLKGFGLSDNVDFHQLDVVNPASIAAAVEFIKTKYGRLDILVNNAGVSGVDVDGDVMIIREIIEGDVASAFAGKQEPVQLKASGTLIQTFQGAEECVRTNYYCVKRITEALIPLLQLSDSPRIVNVSSTMGDLRLLWNVWAKGVLSSDKESLTEERVDEVVQEFLKNFQEGSLEDHHWPTQLTAYKVSKAALNAYTRCIAKKYPSFYINCVCPGFAGTDINYSVGPLSAEEAAESPVKVALLPDGGPSGMFFNRKEVLSL